MMLIPRKNDFDVWEDFFSDPFFDRHDNKIMKTDIKEHKDNYELEIDLPGFEKKDIKIAVDNGYLTISAHNEQKNDEKEHGKYVRRERYFGECSRSFYVGDTVETEDVKASFKNGILNVEIPKKEQKKEIPEKKYVEIKD